MPLVMKSPWTGKVEPVFRLQTARTSHRTGVSRPKYGKRAGKIVLLTGLKDAEPDTQLAALKNCMTPDSRRVLKDLELTEAGRADPKAILKALERFAVGLVNEVIERNSSTKGFRLMGNFLMIS